ncbi:hypothetical protein GGQ64_002011 [Rhizobium azooxidifex]|uniref:Lytic murein transglycosylase n=1 Tax=Mycoplana azooxidifex TaxID=1636188 RepID=A0A7W6D8Y0_9HYPH|nr:hypothetical protein [Mycoplana azooxidifex]MBB3976811.1 hypothetical protein [Mycoplana azooxidifex]
MTSLLKFTPLWPAGHLPLKGGDRLGVRAPHIVERINQRVAAIDAGAPPLVISPLEGEMAGRPEGGSLLDGGRFNSIAIQEARHVPHS